MQQLELNLRFNSEPETYLNKKQGYFSTLVQLNQGKAKQFIGFTTFGDTGIYHFHSSQLCK